MLIVFLFYKSSVIIRNIDFKYLEIQESLKDKLFTNRTQK